MFSSLYQISNATTLQKTVEYIGKLQQERHQMQEETRRLREEIEELNASIRYVTVLMFRIITCQSKKRNTRTVFFSCK